jgi:hypothetical protein
MVFSVCERRERKRDLASGENPRGTGRAGERKGGRGKAEGGFAPFSTRSQALPGNALSTRALAAFAILFVLTAAACASDMEVWQVTPYKIRVFVAFEPCPELTAAVRKDFCRDFVDRIESVVGAPWDVTIVPAQDAERRLILYSLNDLTVEQAAKIATDCDKVMLLATKLENGVFRTTIREFDVRTQQLGPPTARAAWHLGKLRDAAIDALLAAFSPLADVETVDTQKRTTVLHLKAAGLPSRDPKLAVMQPGMIFRAFIRMNDRDGKVRKVTPVIWTYLVVDKAAPERLDCRIESGMATPLNAKRRARMEQLALAIHPTATPTVLVLQSRTEPRVPLPGYQIYDYDKETKDSKLLGRSDWQGQIAIAPDKKVLRTLVVKNGGELLARLPFVAGLEPSVTAEIANDDYRLQAEGFVIGLQDQLVDLFVQRELLRRWALGRIEDGEVEQARTLFNELTKLPTGKVFTAKLTDEKKRLDTKDPVIQAKIEKLFSETKKRVDQCLDDKAIEEVADELRSAKPGTAKKEEAAEPGTVKKADAAEEGTVKKADAADGGAAKKAEAAGK